MKLPRVMLAAPASNTGKTLITCGILQALVNRGLKVSSFKTGPDYIDPMFHSRVIGTRSRNLDTFFTDEDTTRFLFARSAEPSDISVIEGVMGFYDGLGGLGDEGLKASSHDLSRTIDSPVILIVNCKGMSTSVVPMIKGFKEFRDNNIRGVILNNISPAIYDRIKEIVESEVNIKVMGYVPNVKDLVLESRHLGLVLPSEIASLREKLMAFADVLEGTLDLDAIIEMANNAPEMETQEVKQKALDGKVRIALACDEAFCFIYEDNLALLEEMGAELVRFSPMHDAALPGNISGLILYGGYPELHAEALSSNRSMLKDIHEKLEGGMPCLAECGGFMYLHEELEDADGRSHPMVGWIEGRTYNNRRLSRFGYMELRAVSEQMALGKDDSIRGHEFHHWESTNCGEDCEATKPSRGTKYMCCHGNSSMLVGFPHLYYYSNPEVPYRFLGRCLSYQTSLS